MHIADVNRISPGESYEELTPDRLQDLQSRIITLETAMERHVDQWNAPSLLETLDKTDYKIQFGSFNYAFAGGSTAQSFVLPTAWTTEHVVFQISFRPLTAWDATFQLNGCGTGSLTAGSWGIAGTTVQSYEATWISIGK